MSFKNSVFLEKGERSSKSQIQLPQSKYWTTKNYQCSILIWDPPSFCKLGPLDEGPTEHFQHMTLINRRSNIPVKTLQEASL